MQKKRKKNAKKTQKHAKNWRCFLIFHFLFFLRLARGPVFFSVFSCYFFVFFSWSFFPFCVGVLFGPEDPKSNVSYSVFLQEYFADMFSRNSEKPGLEKCGNTSDKAWQPEENKRRNKKQHPQIVKKKRKNSRKKTRKKQEKITKTEHKKKHEKNTKQLKSTILASG